jgi:hypothetical protein
MSGLTQQQLTFFREEGYLLVADAIDPAVLQPLRAEFDGNIDAFARAALADGRLSDARADQPFVRRLHVLALQLDDPAPLLALGAGKQRTPGMFRIYACPSLLDICESVLGPEILAHPQFNVRAKRPYEDEGVVPWHQDLGYLQPDAAETFMVNFWIPLVDATRDNGCMEVIAGSHRAPLLEHEQGMGPAGNFKGVIDEQLPDGDHVLCPVPVGGVLLTQHKTMHRSLPNVSDHIRWSLDLRYSDPAMPTGRDGVPGFIARSAADPGAVCTGVEEWDEIMAPHPVSG